MAGNFGSSGTDDAVEQALSRDVRWLLPLDSDD
jgi:hypothetical protein